MFSLIWIAGWPAASAEIRNDSLLREQVRLLQQRNEYDSAYQAYTRIYARQDSLYHSFYSHEIEPLRDTYQLEELVLDNKRALNSLYLKATLLLGGLIVLGLCGWIFLRWNSRKLNQSRQEMEKAKTLAEVSMRNKSLFLSNMSHEIRTPLNALMGFSDVLATEGIDEGIREQCNSVIRLNSELLLKLINDVIDISCLDVGNMKFDIRTVDAVALCRNIVDTVDKVKHNTEAKLSFETDLQSLMLETDVQRLQQILINLLVNATKFTPKGSIVLKLELQQDALARFSVSDTGCGIPVEKHDKIFKRFEKLNEGAQGFGLGLSICQLIVTRLGGDIWIDSDYKDGARFVFTHPLKQEEEAL
ncbi:MAG: HAMP domain-containing sensor histidine kinase [Bacteroides sp.]|nr:HAMP domain-containing sensor histidine kinase [Bacteroides sp.]